MWIFGILEVWITFLIRLARAENAARCQTCVAFAAGIVNAWQLVDREDEMTLRSGQIVGDINIGGYGNAMISECNLD